LRGAVVKYYVTALGGRSAAMISFWTSLTLAVLASSLASAQPREVDISELLTETQQSAKSDRMT